MKKLLYTIPMLLLAAACAKEPAVQEPEAKRVPLNIMIETKAGGGDSGDEATPYDVNSIRVAVFKNADPSDPTKDLVVVNEYYTNGFEIIGSEEKQADCTYTVAVRPVLELDQNCDDYYVYVVLNESGYKLKGGAVLSTELNALANREEMDALLATPAVYTSAGVTEAPYCLMSASKTIQFADTPGAKDRPMDVKFNTTSGPVASPDEALRRNMAQITVEGIESVQLDGFAHQAELPKVFVLDVKLVNVPADMTWSDVPGSTAGGKVALDIGKANAQGYYDRNWNGSVYRDVNVTMNRLDRPSAKLYRKDAGSKTTWGFENPFLYQVSGLTEPTPVAKPYGFPTQRASDDKWVYSTWDKGKGKNKDDNVADKNQYNTALTNYKNNPPHDPATGNPPDAAEIEAYDEYFQKLKTYHASADASYTSAQAGLKSIDTKYSATNSVKILIDTLNKKFSTKDYDFWENTNTNSEVTAISTNQPYLPYCSAEPWGINLGTSYYVPENISDSFEKTSTTCIYVKLAVANPTIDISKVEYPNLPAPDVDEADISTATIKYYLTNSYFDKPGGKSKEFTELKIQEFDLQQSGDNPKMKVNKIDANGKITGVEDKNYDLSYLFSQNAHIVNASDEMIEYSKTAKGMDIPTANNYHVYVDGIIRKATGLTGISTINQNQTGATFSWGLDTATYKEFYIPVNNNLDIDGDNTGDGYSIVRNTKYTVKLFVGGNTYSDLTKSSTSEDDFGFGVSATVTTEKLTENED